MCILVGPFLSILFEQVAYHGFDHHLQGFHRAALATVACYIVLLAVSRATQHQRDPEREQYTWARFKRQQQGEQDVPRTWWQKDRLWAGVLVACTLGMCWFFR